MTRLIALKNRVFDALQRRFHIDVHFFVGGAFWLSSAQTISSVLSFGLTLAFANLLPKEAYGDYKFILSIAAILAIPTLSGVDSTLIPAVAHKLYGTIPLALKTKIKYGLFGSAASLIVAAYYASQHNLMLATVFLIIAPFVAVMDPMSLYGSILQAKQNFRRIALYNVIGQAIMTAALVLTILVSKDVLTLVLVYFAGWTTIRGIFLYRTYASLDMNQLVDHRVTPQGKHISLVGIFNTVAAYIDRLLIYHSFGAAELAVYTFAMATPDRALVIFKNLPVLALTKLTHKSVHEINAIFKKRLPLVVLTSVILTGGYILIAPFVFEYLFPQYLQATTLSQVYALNMLFVLPNILFGTARGAKITSTPKKFLYLWNLPSILLLVSMATLSHFFGLMGIIVSRIIFQGSNLFLGLFVWHQTAKAILENEALEVSADPA